MSVKSDVISYDVYELDIYKLKRIVIDLGIKEAVIYGIGNNGFYVYRLFKNIGVNIKYYVDVKAYDKIETYRGRSVITPDEFKKKYAGEYVVITPSIHESIHQWMLKAGISNEKLIVPFYKTERIDIDYGGSYIDSPSENIEYCGIKPKHVKGTFVTIAYNTPENLFRRAIESVLSQSEKELKYLIIINGPTDNTLKIAKEYEEIDKRIEIIDLGENLPWTDVRLLSAIRDNVEGRYCCQLDSDDYYAKDFLSETVRIGVENEADIVCVRTCLFSADSSFDPLDTGLEYDWHDKFYFNVVHPRCHVIGHHPITTYYAKSEICSTFWGKLYSNNLMKQYLNYLIELPQQERELYYRLDIAMTYRILSMSERIYNSDKVLHFSQYSRKNSTYTLAPIEWLMSLWYAYSGIKEEMYSDYKEGKAHKYSKMFLKIHLQWMVGRKGMLMNNESWKYREQILVHLREMLEDSIFKEVLFDKHNYMKNDCVEFYDSVKNIVEQGGQA